MKPAKLIGSVVLVFIVAGLGWFGYSRLVPTQTDSADQSQEQSRGYQCPMHPQVTSDKPGSCPICGMDLVLIEKTKTNQHESHQGHEKVGHVQPQGHSTVELSLERKQMIGVKVIQAEKKNLFKSISAPGRVAFDPELYTAQSEYLEAKKQWRKVRNSPISAVKENTRQMIHSSQLRLKVLGLSDEQISDLGKKGYQSEGLLVSGKGQENWVYADIFEVDLPFVKKGLPAKITANFLQGKVLAGEVVSVDQLINPDTRTAKVRIQLLKSDQSIRPESYVNVTIYAPVGEHIAIPLEAILDTGKETFVFVSKGEGEFEPRKVSILLETENETAIRTGLSAGEKVVVGGNFMLDSESRLRAVIKDVNASSHQH